MTAPTKNGVNELIAMYHVRTEKDIIATVISYTISFHSANVKGRGEERQEKEHACERNGEKRPQGYRTHERGGERYSGRASSAVNPMERKSRAHSDAIGGRMTRVEENSLLTG
jgi:hypothetical protein